MILFGHCESFDTSTPIAGHTSAVSQHTAKTVTQLADLTKSYVGAGSVKVSCWPGWWDADSSPIDGSGGTGARIRTNQVGARVTWEVTGTTIVGVLFESSHWSSTNALGEQWTPRNAYWRYRLTTDGAVGSWVYGNRPSHTTGGWVISDSLIAASTYRIEIESTHTADPIKATAAVEYQREPSVATTGENSTMHQIRGFIADAGATYNDLTFAQTALHVLLCGDSNTAGVIDAGTTNVQIKDPGNNATFSSNDQQGHAAQVARTLVETWCAANNRRPVIHNISQGGLWIASMSTAVRSSYISLSPGVASNVADRFNRRTGYTTGSYPSYAAAGRPNPTWTPDLVILYMVTNDQLIEALLGGTSFIAEANGFGGATFRDNAVTLINSMHSTWASAKFLCLNTQRSDGPDAAIPIAETSCHARFAEACGAGYLALSSTNWGRYYDLNSASASFTAGTVHMTAAQHETCRAAAQSTLTALMNL